MFIYFWESVRGKGQRQIERKRKTQNLKQSPGLWAVSTESDMGLELINPEIMTWAEVRCSTNWATCQLKSPSSTHATAEPYLLDSILILWFLATNKRMEMEWVFENSCYMPVCVKFYHIRISPLGVPGWLSRLSIWLQLRSWFHSLWVQAPHWALCWQFRAWSLFWILCVCVSLSLCPPPPTLLILSLSLSKIKIKKNFNKKIKLKTY